MAIKVGDSLPNTKFRVMAGEGPAWKTTDEIFKGKKVALFAVPGAFTGTCTRCMCPRSCRTLAALKAKGIDTVAVTAVNDMFVMDAWKKATAPKASSSSPTATANSPRPSSSASTAPATGSARARKRYSMLVEDGVVKKLNVEEAPARSRSPAATRC